MAHLDSPGVTAQQSGLRPNWAVVAVRRYAVGLLLTCLLPQVAAANPPRGFGFHAQTQQDAVGLIPFDQMTGEARAKVEQVVARPSIYRRMPVSVIQSDADLYRFMVRHPETVVNIWDLMGVTQVQVERTGPFTFNATDGSGTLCQVELIYGDDNLHVLYGTGHYEGSLLKNVIRGSCVMVLKSNFTRTADGAEHVTSQLDMFLRLDNAGAGLLAKTLHPLVGRSADHNFLESARFLEQVSQAAVNRPPALQRLIAKLNKIDPEVKQRFATVAAESHGRMLAQANPGPTGVPMPATVPAVVTPTPVPTEVPVSTDVVVSDTVAPAQAATGSISDQETTPTSITLTAPPTGTGRPALRLRKPLNLRR